MIDCTNAADKSNKMKSLDLTKEAGKAVSSWAIWGVAGHREGVQESHCSWVAFRPLLPQLLFPIKVYSDLALGALQSLPNQARSPHCRCSRHQDRKELPFRLYDSVKTISVYLPALGGQGPCPCTWTSSLHLAQGLAQSRPSTNDRRSDKGETYRHSGDQVKVR